LRSLIKT